MADRTKRIFISDLHLGDSRSLAEPNHYGWLEANIPLLAGFLDEVAKAPDVKELVILGDLFDTWVIPVDQDPLTSFSAICTNPANQSVIDQFKALAESSDVKLALVPGNHDMPKNAADIAATKQFFEKTFPGIRYFCSSTAPRGVYAVGPLVAEHGNHYCLFNGPATWTPNNFLSLGYFISRIVAYQVKHTGHDGDPRDIFIDFLDQYAKRVRQYPGHSVLHEAFVEM